MTGPRGRSTTHFAWRADHRARPAGRRRDYRRRDDDGEDGARLRPRQSRDLRLGIHRLSDADRHVDHGGGLHAGRLRRLLDRRIHGVDVLGAGDRADRLLVRRGDLHSLSRGEALARFRQTASPSRPRRDLSNPRLYPAAQGDHLERRPSRPRRRGDGLGLRARGARLRPCAEAILPAFGAAGTVLPTACRKAPPSLRRWRR